VLCIVLAACEKSGVEPAAEQPVLSSAKGRAALANAVKTALQTDRNVSGITTESNSGANAKGPRHIPFFSEWGDGLVFFDQATGTVEFATFYSPTTDKDFFRKNADGTISGHVNWHNANLNHSKYDENWNELFSYTGTGAKFTSSFTGKWEKISFDWGGVIVEYYIFVINGGFGTYNMQGSGMVGAEGKAPWKRLQLNMVSNPGGIVQYNFSVK
jgi:hypothetical protein